MLPIIGCVFDLPTADVLSVVRRPDLRPTRLPCHLRRSATARPVPASDLRPTSGQPVRRAQPVPVPVPISRRVRLSPIFNLTYPVGKTAVLSVRNISTIKNYHKITACQGAPSSDLVQNFSVPLCHFFRFHLTSASPRDTLPSTFPLAVKRKRKTANGKVLRVRYHVGKTA